MRRHNLLYALYASFFAFVMLISCGPTRPEIIEVKQGFNEYISGYTSGMIQRKGDIRIELAENIPALTTMSKEEINKLFTCEPFVEGEVIAISDRVVEFVPKEPLAVNQFYTMKMNLGEIMDVKSGFEEFTFQFATFNQKIEVDISGLYNYNSYQIEHQYLKGLIETTDFEDPEELKKTLQVTIDGKELPFKLKEYYRTNTYKLIVDSVERLKDAQNLVVSWDGKTINSFSKGSDTTKVSGLSDFSLSNIKLMENDDQQVELTFTEPILSAQNLNGIIQIEGLKELSYKIDFNKVTVFLSNRIIGERKVSINAGIKNIAGYSMKNDISRKLTFREAYPKLRLNGTGSILPNSQGLIFPFEAIALKSVDIRVVKILEKNVHNFLQTNDLDGEDELTRFGKIIAEKKIYLDPKKYNLKQWNTHVIDLSKLIKTEIGAIYQVAIKFDKKDAICDCSESPSETTSAKQPVLDLYSKDPDWNEKYWHTWGYEGYSDWSYGSDYESPCDPSFYYGKAIKRNILASNIGVVFKLDEDKTSHTILSDMITTNPMSGATISFYDYQKKLIGTTTSNAEGMATYKLKEKPFLLVVRKGNERGYLKLGDGHANSLSKFDVSGEVVQKGVKGFIYAERSVWRPGDSLFIHFMLQDAKNAVPNNHPIHFTLKDPNGNTIYEVNKRSHVNGLYDFRTRTSQKSPTGNYLGTVSVGNKTFTKYFKVETIKPNRLKVAFDAKYGKKSDSCQLVGKWLHGASAKGLKANVKVRLSPMRTAFKGYKKYHFDSPIRSGVSDLKVVFNDTLDEHGEAVFKDNTKAFGEVPGMLQANYITKIYEKGGDFSIDRTTTSFSPYPRYIGLATPKTSVYDGTLPTDNQHTFEIVGVTPNGKISNTNVNIRVYRIDWDWWFDGNPEKLASFTSRGSAVIVKEEDKKLINGKTSFQFGLKYPEYGKFLMVVTDQNGGHQTGKVIHIDWPYWSRVNRTNNQFAKMLSFSTDKKSYKKGESVKLTFPSPSNGRALVSIETSERVVKKFWIATEKGETHYEFNTTKEMSPNVFIHITLLQPHSATKNDLPIRMYGVMPIKVDDPATHLHPIIEMKENLRPESKATIRVKEKTGQAMSYTLAIVDDGLLDLTKFRTPQPWNTFHAKEALGVRTWDIYDDVIGAYSGKLDNLLTIGGDGTSVVGNGPKANRFKPMVRFIGPFKLAAGSTRKHTVDIPNYVGSVRVMVVAMNSKSYGNAEKTVKVKKPLMVLATAPRVIGPDETFALPVDVFAMEKYIKNATIRVETNNLLEIADSKKKQLQFASIGDEVVNFQLKAKPIIGIAKIKVIATSGKETATQEIELDIRPANPVIHVVENKTLKKGEQIKSTLIFDGYQRTNAGILEISTLPSIGIEKRLSELINYPHGCVEQTTSSVFPQLFLKNITELSPAKQKEVSTNVKKGIKRLQLFQLSSGGLSYWPGGGTANAWGTNYAGHFLLEAEQLGYKLPTGMKKKWIAYQKDQAQHWKSSNSHYYHSANTNQLTQAYRLYLLALADAPEIGAMNRLREVKDLGPTAKWRLAAAYAKIGQVEIANKLIKGLEIKVPKYRELSYSFGSRLRDRAMILETLGILDKQDKGRDLLNKMAETLRSEKWLSTQETAYALQSIAQFCKLNTSNAKSTVRYQVDGKAWKTVTIGTKIKQIHIPETNGKTKHTVTAINDNGSLLFVTVTTRKIPLIGTIKPSSNGMKLSIDYTTMDGKKIDVKKLTQGTEFMAKVSIRNTSKTEDYKEIALSQIFPSGWELHNHRLFGAMGESSHADYQDIRDDRIYSYFDLKAKETKVFNVAVSAIYQGKFYLPSVYVETMYNSQLSARSAGTWIEVISE